MKYIMFSNGENEVVGITGCVEDWEPEKEFVVAVMSLGYTLLVGDLVLEAPLPVEILAQGDRLYAQAATMAADIERQLAYDVSDDETEQPW